MRPETPIMTAAVSEITTHTVAMRRDFLIAAGEEMPIKRTRMCG